MNTRKLVYILAATVLAAGLASTVVSCKKTVESTAEESLATEAVAADGQASGEEMVELLFVQYAQSVTLNEGVLTLNGVAPETLYFSDRPHRVVGRESTQKFLELWDEGEGSFSQIPPNAVLAVMQKPVPLDLVVVLKNPVLEGDKLTYQVEVLEGPASGEGEVAALFIDVIDFPLLDGISRSANKAVRNIDRRVDDIGDDLFDDSGDSSADDYDDPDDREAYREGYEDGQYDRRYDDDIDDRNEQDAYRKGYENGRRDQDYRDD